jgi:ribonuclease HI
MKQLNLFEVDPPATAKNTAHWHLFVDGASRKNPGIAGAGIYLLKEKELVFKRGFFLGHRTNNQAEYLALLLGLFYWKKLMSPGDTITISSDSELLIKQMKGEYRVRDPILKQMFEGVQELLEGVRHYFTHVTRDRNQEADMMANLGIDKKSHVPQEFITMLHRYGITL